MDLNKLFDYISSHELLSSKEIDMVRYAINEIVEIAPTDKVALFKKQEHLIEASSNIGWSIMVIKNNLAKIKTTYRKLKDPEYTMLVRKGRPSNEAINSEIRFSNEALYDLDEIISNVENIIEYLNTVENNINRYLFMLSDKLKYNN